MKKVIFACVHNAGRSQMAAAFFNRLVDPSVASAVSAGTQPANHVHPEVVTTMKEVGIDLSAAKPQQLNEELARHADLLITMGCGDECPFVPGLKRDDWPLPDPKPSIGSLVLRPFCESSVSLNETCIYKEREKTMETSKAGSSVRKIEIEFLYLDLDICTRCKGTDANLDTALDTVKAVLEASGTEVAVRKVLVDSEATAQKHRFVSSPTIRVNSRDIALESRETPCDSCSEACGCKGSVDCRVWLYDGKEYNEAPVALIVNALLTEIYAAQKSVSPPVSARSFVLPENLKQFFAGKAGKKETDSCCSVEDKTNCCEPSEKESCCGTSTEKETAACGCR